MQNVQDSQEFLRCFMDHLHEELKQPLVDMSEDTRQQSDDVEDTDSEHSSVVEEQPAVFKSHRIPVYCDAPEISDTDYETCDSGLSSENGSVGADTASGSNADCCGSGTTEAADSVDCSSVHLVMDSLTSELSETDSTLVDGKGTEEYSSSELSESVVGDAVKNAYASVIDSSADCEQEVATVPCVSESSLNAGFATSSVQSNVSMPSTDSAISDLSSRCSVQTDCVSDGCHGDECSSLMRSSSSKLDSTRLARGTKRLSPRNKECAADSTADRSVRSRKTTEGNRII